jgi:hypothetical protein
MPRFSGPVAGHSAVPSAWRRVGESSHPVFRNSLVTGRTTCKFKQIKVFTNFLTVLTGCHFGQRQTSIACFVDRMDRKFKTRRQEICRDLNYESSSNVTGVCVIGNPGRYHCAVSHATSSSLFVACLLRSCTKASKAFTLIDCMAVGVDRMQRNLEPMRRRVVAWQRRSELTDCHSESGDL